MKRCCSCKLELPTDNFYKDVSRRDGLSNKCKPCHATRMRKYKKQNPERIKKDKKNYYDANREKLRQYYQDNKEWILRNAKQSRTGKIGYLKTMLASAKSRAKRMKLSFNIDLDYLMTIATDHCPVDGKLFDWDRQLENNNSLPLSTPSLDRIDSSQGYVKGNVAIIGDKWNRWKSNMTLGELLTLAEYVRSVTEP